MEQQKEAAEKLARNIDSASRITPTAGVGSDLATTSGIESPSTFDLTGDYISNPVAASWIFNRQKTLRIKLDQDNEALTGQFYKNLNGTIRGTLKGNQAELTWETVNCPTGEGTLSVNTERKTLEGFLLCRSQGMTRYEVVFEKL